MATTEKFKQGFSQDPHYLRLYFYSRCLSCGAESGPMLAKGLVHGWEAEHKCGGDA